MLFRKSLESSDTKVYARLPMEALVSILFILMVKDETQGVQDSGEMMWYHPLC